MLPSLYVEGTHADFSGQQTVAQISQSLVKSSVMRHKEMGSQKNTQHSVLQKMCHCRCSLIVYDLLYKITLQELAIL